MAGFLNALRGQDKLGMVLYAAKIAIDFQLKAGVQTGQTSVKLGDLDLGNAIQGLSATVGIVAGLNALQFDDVLTQLNGAVGLLSSANTLASVLGATHTAANGELAKGFLSGDALQALNIAGAVLSIANLANLDTMLENGQIGSAAASVIGALNAVNFIATGGSAALAGTGALIALNPVVMVVVAFVLDEIFAEEAKAPPPPPPVGWADFSRNASGQLQYTYHGQTEAGQNLPGDQALGSQILASKMAAIAAGLNQQLAEANASITDPARQLVLVASRLPQVHLQSWASYEGNGQTNYYFLAQMKHAQTGQTYGATLARQDIERDYAGLAIGPEALVQRWQYERVARINIHLSALNDAPYRLAA